MVRACGAWIPMPLGSGVWGGGGGGGGVGGGGVGGGGRRYLVRGSYSDQTRTQ